MVKWLNAVRNERDLCIPEIADKLGMTEADYANLENGDGQEIIDNKELLFKLAAALDSTPAAILSLMFNEKAERRKAESADQAEKPENWLSETADALARISYSITGNIEAAGFMLEDMSAEIERANMVLPHYYADRIRDKVETILFLIGALKGETAKLDDKIGEIEKKGLDEES